MDARPLVAVVAMAVALAACVGSEAPAATITDAPDPAGPPGSAVRIREEVPLLGGAAAMTWRFNLSAPADRGHLRVTLAVAGDGSIAQRADDCLTFVSPGWRRTIGNGCPPDGGVQVEMPLAARQIVSLDARPPFPAGAYSLRFDAPPELNTLTVDVLIPAPV